MERQKNKNNPLTHFLIILAVVSIILIVIQISENAANEFKNGNSDQKYSANSQVIVDQIEASTPLPTVTPDPQTQTDDPSDPYFDTGE